MDNGYWQVECYESGDDIALFNTHEDALDAVRQFEDEDKYAGTFAPGFYAIRKEGADEVERVW